MPARGEQPDRRSGIDLGPQRHAVQLDRDGQHVADRRARRDRRVAARPGQHPPQGRRRAAGDAIQRQPPVRHVEVQIEPANEIRPEQAGDVVIGQRALRQRSHRQRRIPRQRAPAQRDAAQRQRCRIGVAVALVAADPLDRRAGPLVEPQRRALHRRVGDQRTLRAGVEHERQRHVVHLRRPPPARRRRPGPAHPPGARPRTPPWHRRPVPAARPTGRPAGCFAHAISACPGCGPHPAELSTAA